MSDSPDRRTPSALGLAPPLQAAGFNVAGVLSAERYAGLVPPAWAPQAILPAARSVVVLASGGRALGRAVAAAPTSARDRDPFDAHTRRVAEAAAATLREASWPTEPLFYFERRGGAFADFVALGRACGLGTPSRLGLLLHPSYGPWLSIRALLLTARPLTPTPELEHSPCDGCPAPCALACHGAALLPPPSGFDREACTATRRRLEACALRCDARRACVVGPEHAYDPETEAHHMSVSTLLRS